MSTKVFFRLLQAGFSLTLCTGCGLAYLSLHYPQIDGTTTVHKTGFFLAALVACASAGCIAYCEVNSRRKD